MSSRSGRKKRNWRNWLALVRAGRVTLHVSNQEKKRRLFKLMRQSVEYRK